MTCPFCGKADNPAHAKFCSHCGTALLPAQRAQPDRVDESDPASPMSEARATALPGRSRHGFYAGQISHLDQVEPAHSAVHARPPHNSGHAERTNDARPGADAASQPVQAGAGHFDERYAAGGRFVSRRTDASAAVEPPVPPAPEPERRPVITPEMVFRFGPKVPPPGDIPAPTPVPAAAGPRPVPPIGGALEPDPVSRSFGTWATPSAPTSRPDFMVAAQQAQEERGVGAADVQAAQVDLSTVRDLFPEPRWEGESRPLPPVEPPPSVAPDDRPIRQAAEQERHVEPGVPQTADAPADELHVAAATASGPQDAAGETGTASAGPAGAADAPERAGGDAAAVTPPTKQSRYWATGAHASAFVGAWMGGVPAFIGPLVVWLARRDSDPFAAEHGRNALNFNLSVIVYVLGLIVVSIITFGVGLLVTIPGFIALGLAWFAFTVVGTIKAASSESYKYPLTIRFVR